MGFSGMHSDRGLTSEIHQCEMCARWTHDGAFVGEGSNGADEHFVCHRCERERPTTILFFALRSTGGSVVGRCDDEHFQAPPFPFWRLDNANTIFRLTSGRYASQPA